MLCALVRSLHLYYYSSLPACICNPASCATSSALTDGNHDYAEDVRINISKDVWSSVQGMILKALDSMIRHVEVHCQMYVQIHQWKWSQFSTLIAYYVRQQTPNILAICVQLNPNSSQKLDYILFKYKSRSASSRFWQDPPGCANRHLIHLTPGSMHIQWPYFL